MSAIKHIYFLRHGETDQNKFGIVQGRGINSELNQTGLRQAEALYNKLKLKAFDLLIASTLQRSYQTIQLFENEFRPIQRDPRIDEISWGEHEGKGGEPDLMEKYFNVIQSWNSGDYHDKAVGAESAHELSERLNSFIQDLEKRDFNYGLICTHGRTLRVLICILKNWPLSKMENVKHNNTGLYHASFHEGKWDVHFENDLTHLD